jgi:ATP-binding cassette subfamily B protein
VHSLGEPTQLPSTTPRAALRIAWQLMDGFRGQYLLAIGAMLLASALGFVVPLITSTVIDVALAEAATEATDSSGLAGWIARQVDGAWLRDHLWAATIGIIALTALAGGFNYLKGKYAALASDGIARRLKDRLYDHLQHLPLGFHDRQETGDLVQRCTSDVETFRLALSLQVVQVSHSVVLVLLALPAMLSLDPQMTAASFVLILPLILFGYVYFARVRKVFLDYDEAEGAVTARVQENLTGLRVVRAFSRQPYEIERFDEPNRRYRDNGLRLVRLMSIYWSVSDYLSLAQLAIVLGLGIHLVTTGSMTIGTLFAFMVFLNLMLWPMRQMGRTLTDLGKSVVALGRIREILDTPVESAGCNDGLPQRASGHLQVSGLSFSHGGEMEALKDISFELHPGETLAILGPSGAGKSTLMHLLLRLYDYQTGSIRLDGHELAATARQWVRQQFAVVMQEPFLFSRSIVDNVTLGRPTASEQEIEEAATTAHIHTTINSFPQGYQTLVGERGVTLSGGQRQRVALARALLRDAPVLLLDDALSAVDTETEEWILNALRSRHGQRTTLVIAHRLSTLAHADKIVVMDHGRIIEAGTHEQLMLRAGMYHRLWKIQNEMEVAS